MDNALVGWLLVVVGFLFVFVGFAAAVKKVFGGGGIGAQAFDPSEWEKFITALTNLIAKAPEWLLLSAAGAGFIFWGSRIVADAATR